MFKNKKILFIGPIFYQYHHIIIEELRSNGAEVVFFPERKYGWVFKLINNFFPRYLFLYQRLHYSKALKLKASGEFDYLFVIKGFMCPEIFIKKLKEQNPNIKTFLYQWDSNKSNPYFHLVDLFDKVYSFDYQDCRINSKLVYLPLFYTNDIEEQRNENFEELYHFFFMGSYLPERYEALLKFRAFVLDQGWKIKTFLYMPYSSYLKEVRKGIKLDRSLISFQPMVREEYLYHLMRSKVVVDVSSSSQSGLSMRVIEGLASGKKILTNNKVFLEDIDPLSERIIFFDEKNPSFNELDFKPINKNEVVSLYVIGDWLNKIFTHK
jgi:hypothetical protein